MDKEAILYDCNDSSFVSKVSLVQIDSNDLELGNVEERNHQTSVAVRKLVIYI